MMMNNTLRNIFILMWYFASQQLHAQAVLEYGLIKFEKKVNMHKQMDGFSGEWAEMAKKNMPKYNISNFELQFTPTASIYKKSKDQPPADPRMRGGMMREDDDKNIVYKNIDSASIVSQKQVFEKMLLIKDTLPKMEWKITNEFKRIADKNCRKATAIVMDSVYIIAFYTDDIICSSGPETLNGLPGMILGVAIPRLNVTYFATSITQYASPVIDAPPTSKNDAVTYKQLIEKLEKSLDDWGKKWKSRSMWNLLL